MWLWGFLYFFCLGILNLPCFGALYFPDRYCLARLALECETGWTRLSLASAISKLPNASAKPSKSVRNLTVQIILLLSGKPQIHLQKA